MREELLSPEADPVEAAEETTLRPRRLDEFVGQPRLREHLEIMLTASRQRGQAALSVAYSSPNTSSTGRSPSISTNRPLCR